MQIELVHDVAVSPPPPAGKTLCSAYPQLTVTENGDILVVYRQGAEKHSFDGILMMQRSSDMGKSWSKPRVLFDSLKASPPQCVLGCGICSGNNKTLLATLMVIEATQPDVYVFDENGKKLPRKLQAIFSKDNGETWGKPNTIDISGFSKVGLTTKPAKLSDGSFFVPVNAFLPSGILGTAATFTTNGKDFEPIKLLISDNNQKFNYCDAHFTTLSDGRMLAFLWKFSEDDEITVNVHSSFSNDCGRSWDDPKDTGFQGQLAIPLQLSDGSVIAATTNRVPPAGILLWFSKDAVNWDCKNPVLMWDPEKSQISNKIIAPNAKAEDHGVWDALKDFTFGTPDMIKLDDNSVLLTYYATIEGRTHIRACRFYVK